jgi:hypothetical protein
LAQAAANWRSQLATVIRLHRRAHDYSVHPARQGFGQAEFQHARFVAAKGQTSQIIALDVDRRAAERRTQARQRF